MSDAPISAPHEPDCPICGEATFRSLPARIAPFIIERCDLSIDTPARSHLCGACEHVFLTPFLSEAQLTRLYEGYRGEAYDRQRLRLEPDYEGHQRGFVDRASGYHLARRAFYDTFHGDRFATRGLVVDVGDGDGYFARYAYPNADVVTFPRIGAPAGVDLGDLLASADVLMMTHSLQADPRPRRRLCELAAGLGDRVQVWIETPVNYQPPLAASFALLESRATRGVPPGDALLTLHENLAHFSVRSLRRLLRTAGLRAVEFVQSSSGILGVLAVRDDIAGQAAAPTSRQNAKPTAMET